MSPTQFRALYTQMVIDTYLQRPQVTSFIKTFFPEVFTRTKYAVIEVMRFGEDVAIDITRGAEGNRNKFSLSTEKRFEPPYYNEWFDATREDLYDQVIATNGTDAGIFAALLQSIGERLGILQDKIERAKELMCVQVLETGTVTLKDGTVIDFKRKAGSIVDPGAGQYWANNIDVFDQLEAGCNFIRTKGKSGDSTFNLILGATAYANLRKNTKFTDRQSFFNMKLDDVIGPVRDNNNGAAFHGTISTDSYKLQLWTYPQFYKNAAGVDTPYLNAKLGTIIPSNPRFKMACCAVPQLLGAGGSVPQQGPYLVRNVLDPDVVADKFIIETAPIPIPVAVDTIYTLKGVA